LIVYTSLEQHLHWQSFVMKMPLTSMEPVLALATLDNVTQIETILFVLLCLRRKRQGHPVLHLSSIFKNLYCPSLFIEQTLIYFDLLKLAFLL
jgi:hypothetical protein